MGGPGSGNRWRLGSRSTTDEYRRLDVRALVRAGVLKPGYAGGWQWTQDGERVAWIKIATTATALRVMYRHRSGDESWKEESYQICFVHTPCHFGGARVWFLCPARGCKRRVAVLYGGGVFACRHCYGLAYACTRESASDRATRRADKIRIRLGWETGILNDPGDKPKWMRWRTYERLVDEHDRFSEWSVALVMQQLRAFCRDG